MTTATGITALTDKHRSELHASGLTDQTIAAAGIYSADSGQIKDILGWAPNMAALDWLKLSDGVFRWNL